MTTTLVIIAVAVVLVLLLVWTLLRVASFKAPSPPNDEPRSDHGGHTGGE